MESKKNTATQGISLSLEKGPFQNNGASPWYANLGLGTLPQGLKFSFDTGSNFNWVTSSLCLKDGCKHTGGDRFIISNSSTFKKIELIPTTSNPTPHIVDFGPWGSMEVNAGSDIFTLFPSDKCYKLEVEADIYTAKAYKGQQFEELDWDGGIGLPSLEEIPDSDLSSFISTRYRSSPHYALPDAPTFHFFRTLVEKKYVSRDCPYVGFKTNLEDDTGVVDFGRLDQSFAESKEYLFLPWDKYSIDAVSYLWTTKLFSFSMNGTTLLKSDENNDAFFSLDSGSSQFKGDVNAMFSAFQRATFLGGDLEIEVGKSDSGELGKIVVPSSVYNCKIEEGEFKGNTIAQFAPLEGVANLALVGSVLMDHLYTVYEYTVQGDEEDFTLIPKGMWIFNRLNGIKLIKTVQKESAPIFSSNVH